MPLALLQYKKGRELTELAENLAKRLPEIVAPALTVPAAQLTPDDVTVWCVEGGSADVNSDDLEILIWAHDFPERKETLEERKELVLKGIRRFLIDYRRNVSGFVWILLQPTAYGTI